MESREVEEAEKFETHLLAQNLAFKTISEYMRYWSWFHPEILTQENVTAYLSESPNGMKRAFLRQYLKFRKVRDIDILQMKGSPPKKVVRLLPDEDVDTLRRELLRKNPKFLLMFDVMFTTGVRISELCSLTIGNIEKNSLSGWQKGKPLRLVLLNTKRMKERFIILSPSVANDMIEHIDEMVNNPRIQTVNSETSIFGMKAHAWYDVLQNVSKKFLGINYNPHSYRHRAITSWLRNGVPIEKVANRAGHSNVSVTQRYSHITSEEIAEDWENEYKKD